MRRKIAVLVVVLSPVLFGFGDCFNPTTINTQDNRSGDPTSGSLVCADLISHLEVGLVTGGQSFKVGDTLVFGANPVTATGDNVPTECRAQAVTAQALGTCAPVAGHLPFVV